jgi:hypothetical protein
MGYSSFLKPRQETISDPTTDVIKVLDEINVRFSSSKESSGLFFRGPEGNRSREMLLEKGPEALSDATLLAILLRTLQARQKCHSPCKGNDHQVWRAQLVDDGNI